MKKSIENMKMKVQKFMNEYKELCNIYGEVSLIGRSDGETYFYHIEDMEVSEEEDFLFVTENSYGNIQVMEFAISNKENKEIYGSAQNAMKKYFRHLENAKKDLQYFDTNKEEEDNSYFEKFAKEHFSEDTEAEAMEEAEEANEAEVMEEAEEANEAEEVVTLEEKKEELSSLYAKVFVLGAIYEYKRKYGIIDEAIKERRYNLFREIEAKEEELSSLSEKYKVCNEMEKEELSKEIDGITDIVVIIKDEYLKSGSGSKLKTLFHYYRIKFYKKIEKEMFYL